MQGKVPKILASLPFSNILHILQDFVAILHIDFNWVCATY